MTKAEVEDLIASLDVIAANLEREAAALRSTMSYLQHVRMDTRAGE